MIGVFKTKPAITLAIIAGLTAIVFVAQAFFSPHEAESQTIKDYIVSLSDSDYESYSDPAYGFTISIPKDFIISSSPLEDSEMLTGEHSSMHLGFEIFITRYEGDDITAETIREANPDLVVKDPIETELIDGTPAIRFASEDDALGETRQFVFVHGGSVFQVILYSANTEWLDSWARELPHDWEFDSLQN